MSVPATLAYYMQHRYKMINHNSINLGYFISTVTVVSGWYITNGSIWMEISPEPNKKPTLNIDTYVECHNGSKRRVLIVDTPNGLRYSRLVDGNRKQTRSTKYSEGYTRAQLGPKSPGPSRRTVFTNENEVRKFITDKLNNLVI